MDQLSEVTTQFEEDIINGLLASHKNLPSKYFYDKRGDELFQQIMALDEYYLTNKEREIFETCKQGFLDVIGNEHPFQIIELGAGDGTKTKIVLKHFLDQKVDFTYCPIDISGNVLEILEGNLKSEMPKLNLESFQGDYFQGLETYANRPGRNVVFFLGSNIGNFGDDGDFTFLNGLSQYLNPGDLLLMGVDLKKDPAAILAAYNDSKGITREFNLNLLDRINSELDGDINRNQFLHYPYYNPQTGECRSYLISTCKQQANIAGRTIHFEAWEAIFMEISKKYDEAQLKSLAKKSGFKPLTSFRDSKNWFANVVWEKR